MSGNQAGAPWSVRKRDVEGVSGVIRSALLGALVWVVLLVSVVAFWN